MKYLAFLGMSCFLVFMSASFAQVHAYEFDAEPTHIIIPRLHISLPVHTAEIEFNTWKVRLDGASFGETTTLPGNQGNTVIFSHAIPQLFGSLPAIQKGDEIDVFTQKDWFVYTVDSLKVVDPTNISVLNADNTYQLTVYTCTGPNFSQRFVVKAHLLSVL